MGRAAFFQHLLRGRQNLFGESAIVWHSALRFNLSLLFRAIDSIVTSPMLQGKLALVYGKRTRHRLSCCELVASTSQNFCRGGTAACRY